MPTAPDTAAAWYPLAHPGAIEHITSNTGKILDIRYPAGHYTERLRIDGVNTTVVRGAAHCDLDLAAGTTSFIRKEPDRLATYVHGHRLRDSLLTVAHIGDEHAVPGATYRITGGVPPGEDKVREARRIGRKHAKAAAAGRPVGRVGPGVVPGLDPRHAYTRQHLAADLGLGLDHGLVPDEEILTRAADAYLAAAGEARLAAGTAAASARCAACGLSQDAHPYGWGWRPRRPGEAQHPIEHSCTSGDSQDDDPDDGSATVFVLDHPYAPREADGDGGGR